MNVKELAPQLAAHLGPTWTVSSEHDATASQAMLRSGHALMHISTGYNPKDRLNISASFTQDLYKHRSYKAEHHAISVSVNKTPVQIATDIRRRLLPEYESELRLLIERRDASSRYEEAKLITYSKALRVVNKIDSDPNRDLKRVYVGPANFSLEANNETSVELNRFQLTPAQLLRIKEACPELFTEAQ